MSTLLKILFNILVSIATEKMLRNFLAEGLDIIVASTKNKIDDKLAGPVIAALRERNN